MKGRGDYKSVQELPDCMPSAVRLTTDPRISKYKIFFIIVNSSLLLKNRQISNCVAEIPSHAQPSIKRIKK